MDYGKAKDIRQQGLFSLMTDRLSSGQGTGSSIKSAISDRTQATFTGIKEKFDPMNIAKVVTGGSKFAPALVGALMGRSKEDISFFTGKKRKKKLKSLDLQDSSSNESMVEVLGLIYRLMCRIEDDRKKDLEESLSKDEENDEEDRFRNEKLIEALTGKKQKKSKKETKIDGKLNKRVEEQQKKIPKIENKGEVKKSTGSKKPSLEKKEIKPSQKLSEATDLAKKALAKKKTGSSIIGDLFTKKNVAIAGAGALAAGTMGSAIGGAESGGNYNVSYGDRLDKSGKLTNTLGLKTPEEFSGKKLTDMTLQEVKEFGAYRSQDNKGAGAVGKYQFMPSTLFGRKGAPGLVQQLGLDMNTKFSPQVQEKLQELLHTQDVATLKKMGVPITPGYEYMAHYIGAGGAAAVYQSIQKGENKTVAQVMTDKGYPIGNNPELHQIRAVEFEGILQSRLQKKGGLASPHSAGNVGGDRIDNSSKENTRLKKDIEQQQIAKKSSSSTNINANTTESNDSPEVNDENPYLKKARIK
jgi:hypothetical protein